MKKNYILLLFLLLSSIFSNLYAQGSNCANTDPFCAGGASLTFPNSTGTVSETGINYECLGSQPNPAWFFMQIGVAGNINFQISQTSTAGTPIDVDYILWGPFSGPIDTDDPFPYCGPAFLNPTTSVSCSFSAAAIENFIIPSAIVGDIYVVLLTNYSGAAGNITVTQTNVGATGAGATDCNIVCPLSLGPNVEICPGTSTTLTATIPGPNATYVWSSTAPGFVNPGTQSITVSAPGTYTVVVNKPGCVANGTDSVDITLATPPATGTPNDLIACDSDPFNLTENTPVILNGLTDYTISYHTSLIEAQNGTGGIIIPNPSNYPGVAPFPQTIYASIEDNNTSCIFTTSFTIDRVICTCETVTNDNGDQTLCLNATANPTPFAVSTDTSGSISYVYFNTPQTGAAMYTGGILLGNVNPVAGTATYDAPLLGTSGSLPSIAGTYYVYAILSPTPVSPVCRDYQEIIVTINTTPVAPTPSDVTVCDSYILPALPVGQSYHTASGGTGTTLSAGTSITTTQTIYVFAQTGTTPNCTSEGDFVVTVNTTPVAPNPSDVTVCDSYILPALSLGQSYHTASGGAGTTLLAGASIITTQTIYVFAQTGTTPNCTSEGDFVVTVNNTPTPDNPADVTACSSYTLPNLVVGNYFTAPNGGGTPMFANDVITTNQTLYVYAETGSVPNCFAENSFTITITSPPVINTPSDYVLCDQTDNNGFQIFDLSTMNSQITADSSLTITYHETYDSSAIGGASYANIHPNINPGFQTIYVAVFNPATPTCRTLTQFDLIVNPLPLPNPVITDYELCDVTTPGDGLEIFDLSTKTTEIANGQTNVTITYYDSLTNATNQTSPLPTLYQNTTPNQQTIWINISDNTTGCNTTGSFELIVNPLPTVVAPNPMYECSNGVIMTAEFDLPLNDGFISGGNPGVTVTYYLTLADAQNQINPLPIPYTNISNPQTIIVCVKDNTTGCFDTTTLELNVTQGPVAITPTPLEYCDPNNDGFGEFDLASTINEIAGGTLPLGVSVSFYETATDAQLGGTATALTSPYTNINPNTQTIYVRVFYTLTGCANFVSLQLIVNPTPEATVPQDYHECDNDYDGFTVFDLSSVTSEVLGSIDPATHTVSYYTTFAAAQLGTPAISNLTTYSSDNQTIYVRVETIATGCFDIVALNLVVDPLPTATQPAYAPYSLCETTAHGVGFESFDLLSTVPTILMGQTGVGVTFYPSYTDAQNGTNVILTPSYVNQAIYVQTLGIRLTNETTGCYVVSSMDIRVEPIPTPVLPLVQPTICDTNQDGFFEYDLDSLTIGLQGGTTPPYIIRYYETQTDAQIGSLTTALTSPYPNINPFTQPIWVRAEDALTGCYSVSMLTLTVNPSPIMPTLDNLTLCDQDSNPYNGSTMFNLTQQTPIILAAQNVLPISNYTVTYYTTLANAQTQTSNIVPTTTYTNATNPQTIWVVVKHNITGCFEIGTFQLIVNTPLALTTPTPLSLCDSDAISNNQYTNFNLTVKNDQITGVVGSVGYTVTYYPSYALAQTGNIANAIADPTNYTNIFPAVQTLGVVVTTSQGCTSVTTLDIRVLPIPEPNTDPAPLAPQCDYNLPGDMLETFDLTVNATYIMNGDSSLTLEYYPTQGDAIAQTNQITIPNAALVGANVWIRVENNRVDYLGNNCYVLVEQALTVNPLPVISTIADYQICEDDALVNDGFEIFDLTSQVAALLASNPTTSTYTLTYHTATPPSGLNQIANPSAFTNTINPQIIYVVATNDTTGCRSQVGQFNILVNPRPEFTQPTTLLNTCDDDGTNDGEYAYPLDGAVTTEILNGQDPTLFTVTFYNSEYNPDATIPLLPPAITDLAGYMGYTHTIWAAVTNNATGCQKTGSFAAIVEQLPEPEITTVNDINTICVDFTDNVVVRELTLTANNNTVYYDETTIVTPSFEYHWYEDGVEVGVTTTNTFTITDTLNDATSSVFTVEMVNVTPLGCSQVSAGFDVIQSGPAEILNGTAGYTVTNAFSDNQIITVTYQGHGTYVFSLDDGPRQESPIFENVSLGEHTITVYDTEGGLDYSCDALFIQNVQTIDYPHYFTPNGDGIHDNWNVVGLDEFAKIYIFDRFGKLIKQISPLSDGWDGSFNGQPLPSTDYWFTVDYLEQSKTKQFKAHFSLKR